MPKDIELNFIFQSESNLNKNASDYYIQRWNVIKE